MVSERLSVVALKPAGPVKSELLRISEVARAAGVPTATIHYYMKEGLLTSPSVTSRNMAYYDPHCVEEIRFIKGLQSKRYLPLSVIKLILKARREGEEPAHLMEMSEIMGDIFKLPEKESGPESVSFTELSDDTGLSRKTLKKIEALGLIDPVGKTGDERYDDIDIRVARTVKELMDQGLTIDDLKVFSQYVKVVRNIARTVHLRVHDLHDGKFMRLADLSGALDNLKDLLTVKVHREMFKDLHK
jgi:DNA-binding transcriptional MerR regulator